MPKFVEFDDKYAGPGAKGFVLGLKVAIAMRWDLGSNDRHLASAQEQIDRALRQFAVATGLVLDGVRAVAPEEIQDAYLAQVARRLERLRRPVGWPQKLTMEQLRRGPASPRPPEKAARLLRARAARAKRLKEKSNGSQ